MLFNNKILEIIFFIYYEYIHNDIFQIKIAGSNYENKFFWFFIFLL